MDGQTFRTEFIVEFEHARNSIVHLRRSFEELQRLQERVAEEEPLLHWDKFVTVDGETMPVREDGREELFEDADMSLLLREVVSVFLCCVA